MPFIQVNVPTGGTDAAKKAELIENVTDTVTSTMGVPAEVVHVHINEVAEGGYATAGKVIA
ncbi:MAG: 4-oxalocrotonate tautomerase family protein [Actinomycetota bacterium]